MGQDTAIVTATFSRRMQLQLCGGDLVDARIKGKRLKPVCGDEVLAIPIENESDWLITEILERRNQLTRPNSRGQVEVLAANFDVLIVVVAVSPLPDWYIVDRYICAAELMGVDAIVVFNKVDLMAGLALEIPELEEYRDIDLPVFEVSATTGSLISELQAALTNRRAVIVGQSGVGKSSLINQLADQSEQRTATISGKTGEGRHTTVNSVMIPLRGGGSVIDSPGVRDYAPALSASQDAALGFREITAAAQLCKFSNCRHLREPGCAVKAAVEADTISYRRYESFKRVVNMTEQLMPGRN